MNLYHFAYALKKPTSNALFWAVTVVNSPRDMSGALKKGANVIRAAVINAGGATDFCARFLNGDDAPIKGITVSLAR